IYQQQLVVRRDEQRITSLDDCRNLRVGTLGVSSAFRLLQARGFTNIVAFDGQIEPYLDLERGRVDAVLLDAPIATFLAAPNPNLKEIGAPLAPGEYGIGLARRDEELQGALDEALHALLANGR